MLKEDGTAHWNSPNNGATNEFGFTALPAGLRSGWDGDFYNLGTSVGFWSSTESNYYESWYWRMEYDNDDATKHYHQWPYGYSVRCIQLLDSPIIDCDELLIDDRNEESYTTILIGDQCWMGENLNIGNRVDITVNQSNNSELEKHCYNDLESNCDIYGGLFEWDELMQYSSTPGIQGICPVGWHIPTDEEYSLLVDYLGDENTAGGKMKEQGTAHWNSPNTGATNESNFTALPGGVGDNSVYLFGQLGIEARFWSSTYLSSNSAWYRTLFYDSEIVSRSSISRNGVSLSVRCLKN